MAVIDLERNRKIDIERMKHKKTKDKQPKQIYLISVISKDSKNIYMKI